MGRLSTKVMTAFVLCLAAFLLAGTTSFASTLPGTAQKIADPDTSSSWQSLFDIQSSSEADRSYSTQEAGRIWVDKSVYTDSSAAGSAGIPEAPMVDSENDFIVGLSMLSASSTVRRESPYSHDVVFVVSLNSAMASLSYDGQPYAAHMTEALNEAIARLMAENVEAGGADAKARVAVIGYSVDVTVLMPLDTYRPDENGDYIVYSSSTEHGAAIKPVATPDTPGVRTQDETVRGSAYLQRAVADAAEILEDGASEASSDSPRKPELVIMGASVPLMANTDIAEPPTYLNETAMEDGFVGSMPANHNAVGFGTDAALATLLTLQHERDSVDRAYATANGETSSDSGLDVWTVGLDTSGMAAYVLQTASGQASADVLETVGTAKIDLTDNIELAREAYARAAEAGAPEVELDLYGTGTGGIKSETLAFPHPIDGLLSVDDGYAFDGASEYYLATDAGALSGGFNAAVDRILGIRYSSPVNEGEGSAADSSDRLRIQDDIGDAMNVKRVEGILYQGTLLDGSLAAQAMSASFADPWDVESYHEVDCIMDSLNTRYDLGWDAYNLLYDAYRDGQFAYRGAKDYSNYVSWFTDSSHAMVKTGSAGYTFASNEVIAAAESGNWRDSASDAARESIEQAVSAGATAVCQTYFYIGNIEDQYTGDDVPLYDFVVMVETDLETGHQQVLLTIPADSIPARKAYVTEHLDGSVTMTLDPDAESTVPLRLVYEVGPSEGAIKIAERMAAGEEVPSDEIENVLGSGIARGASGQYLLYTNGFSGAGPSATADTVMSAVTATTNSYYSFTRDTPLYTLRTGESVAPDESPDESQIEPLTTEPRAGETYYYLDTYYRAEGLDFGSEVPAEAVTSVEPYTVPQDSSGGDEDYVTSSDGQYAVRAGTPKYLVSSMLADYSKSPNTTASASYVKQIEVSDYSSLGRSLISARLGNNGVFAIFPARKTGSITVEKHLQSQDDNPLLESDYERSFDFEVALSDKSGQALSGTVPLARDGKPGELIALEDGGIARFSLRDGQSATLEGLPEGTRYVVTEAADGGFGASFAIEDNGEQVASGNGSDTGEQTLPEGSSTISFTNTKQGGSLVISKRVAGNAADPSESFSFRIDLTDHDGTPLTGSFAYGLFEGTDPTDWDAWSLGTATVDEDGVLALENGAPALADGQSIAICGLPVGSEYAVSEAEGTGYTSSVSKTVTDGDGQESSSDARGTIAENGQVDALTFTNEKWTYGSLRLTKRAYGADEGTAFGFSVVLQDPQGRPLSGTYTVTLSDGTDSSSSEQRVDETGALGISLTDGQSAEVEGIPQGTRYRIEELDGKNEYLVLAQGAEGIVGEKVAQASFTNVRQTGALGIINAIGGNAGDQQTSCSYELTVEGIFTDGASTQQTVQAYRYDSSGGRAPLSVTFERVSGTTAGTAVIDGLKGGEGVLIDQLPASAPFTVTELNADDLAADGYAVSSGIGSALQEGQASVSGSLDPDAVTTASFLNVKNEYGALSVVKRISGNAALDEAEQGRSFTFAVQASDRKGEPLSGSFEATTGTGERTTVLFENGTATFSLPAPKSAEEDSVLTITGIPANSSYRVTEQDMSASGYRSSSAGDEGVIGNDPDAPSTARFTNEKEYAPLSMPIGGLEVLKGKSSEAGAFAFQLFEEDGVTPALDADGSAIVSTSRASGAGVPVSFILNGLEIDEPGEHRYVVRETVPEGGEPLAGVTYDETAFTVHIAVKASATGKLYLKSLSYSVDAEPVFGVSFVNEYRSATGSFTLRARKELLGAALADAEFAFSAQEVDPVTLEPISAPIVARNASDGTVTFPSLSAAAPQGSNVTRAFVISENLPPSATSENGYTAAGTTYDTVQYLVTVTGESQSGSSDLAFSSTVSRRILDASDSFGPWQTLEGTDALSAGKTAPAFTNSHATSPTSTSIVGHISYRDETGTHPLEDGMFRFALEAVGENSESAPLPEQATVANVGNSFSLGPIDIAYDSDLVGKTFTYEVHQVIPDSARYSEDGREATLDGMTYDARVQTVSIEIVSRTADDGSRFLEAVVTYPEVDGAKAGFLEFRNAYAAKAEPPAPEGGGNGTQQETETGQETDGLVNTGDIASPRTLATVAVVAALMVAIPLILNLRTRRK